MANYHAVMVAPAVLPDEAVDVTASELHQSLMRRLTAALTYLFGDAALVLADIFVRVDDTEQVAPDLLVVRSARRGTRRAYRVPDEPVPDITIEILSAANYGGEGEALLHRKRQLLGAIGVPVHIEIDPERGYLTRWENRGGQLVVGPPTDHYDGPELAGLQIRAEPGRVRLWGPGGRELLDPAAEMARADAEAERADAEAERADAEAEKAARLAEALRAAGIDPDAI